jgi:hypothetical protein
MLKPIISTLAVGMAATASVTAVPIAAAAELAFPARVVHVRHITITACAGAEHAAAFMYGTFTTGNCTRPTVLASIHAISIRQSRTIILGGCRPTRDTGSGPIRRSDRPEVSTKW